MSLVRACWVSAAVLGALGAASCLGDFGKYTYTPTVCGNLQIEYGEECDNGGVLDDTCTPSCNVPRCGDGYLSPNEGCDDGNLKDGDSCNKTCQPTKFFLQENVGSASATYQLRPSIGLSMVDGEPHFVVAWVQVPSAGAKRRIVKRTYLLDGSTVEDAPVVLSNSPNDATCTAMASNSAGRSLVVWDESPATGAEVHYNVVEPSGEIWSTGDQLLTGSALGVFQGCPAVAATDTGEFCILWQGGDNNEHVDCFDPTGQHAGTSQTLTGAISSGSSRQWGARAIWGVNGGFVGSWFDSFTQPADQNHYLDGAQFDATGVAVGNPIVFSQLFYDYDGNGFSWGSTGAFVTSYGMRGMFGQTETKTRFLMSRYDSYDQPPVQQDVPVSDTHTDEFGGRLIGHSSGRFAAAWSALSGDGCDVLYRKFKADGTQDGAAASVGLDASKECGERVVGVATEAGDVMMVWTWRNAASSGSANLQGIIVPRMLAQ
jgi:cysteine-rich repeat protein